MIKYLKITLERFNEIVNSRLLRIYLILISVLVIIGINFLLLYKVLNS